MDFVSERGCDLAKPTKSDAGRMSLLAAFMASPGPATAREALILFAKAFCMGVADIIPGISGGTVAFIIGIYQDLLAAVKSVGARFICKLASLDLPGALAQVHIRFLLTLGLGIGTAILLAAHAVTYLLAHFPVFAWSVFFGLITASALVVAGRLARFGPTEAILMLIGSVGGYLLMGMIPMQTPDTFWFLFLSGAIAISAMILPGISGSFLLLVLGKYETIIQAVRNPLLPENLAMLAVFGLGCALGLAGSSRFVHFLLRRYHDITVAVMAGFVLGATRKIWPWKEVLEERVVSGKIIVTRAANVLPDRMDGEVILAFALMLAGFMVVLLLNRLGRKRGEAKIET